MRAVVQRVLSASVVVDGQTISSIEKGLLVLVGIDRYDTPTDSAFIIKKVLGARLFEDSTGNAWKQSVKDIDGEVLCVSQFTLCANFKGNKPDFHESMSSIPGKAMYSTFLDEIRAAYREDRIQDGQFGAMMKVSLVNDGPVTVTFDSHDKISKPTSGNISPNSSSTPTPNNGPNDEEKAKVAKRFEAKKMKQAEYEAKVAAKVRARDGLVGQFPHQSTVTVSNEDLGSRLGSLNVNHDIQ